MIVFLYGLSFLGVSLALTCHKTANQTNLNETTLCDDFCLSFYVKATEALEGQEWQVQDCGSGEMKLTQITPEQLHGFFQEETVKNPCLSLNLTHGQKTCTSDPRRMLEATMPPKFQLNFEAFLGFIDTVSVCCCSSDFCNELSDGFETSGQQGGGGGGVWRKDDSEETKVTLDDLLEDEPWPDEDEKNDTPKTTAIDSDKPADGKANRGSAAVLVAVFVILNL